MAAHSSLFTACSILFTRVIYVRRYISEQKATLYGREAGASGAREGSAHPQGQDTHTRSARRVRYYRASQRRPSDSPYSYYYERRNAFCRARTKFVALRSRDNKDRERVSATEVCLTVHRCRASDRAKPNVFRVPLSSDRKVHTMNAQS